MALQAIRAGWVSDTALDVAHAQQLAQWASGLNVRFEGGVIDLDGEDVGLTIRTEEVEQLASKIATVGVLREALLQRQRDFAQGAGLVARGRDMASVVFPHAAKVFDCGCRDSCAKALPTID